MIFEFQNLVQSTNSVSEKACLFAVSFKNAGDWLNAMPISSLGLKLGPISLKISCAHWFGSKLCQSHQCIEVQNERFTSSEFYQLDFNENELFKIKTISLGPKEPNFLQ